jgi:hypothetical protein
LRSSTAEKKKKFFADGSKIRFLKSLFEGETLGAKLLYVQLKTCRCVLENIFLPASFEPTGNGINETINESFLFVMIHSCFWVQGCQIFHAAIYQNWENIPDDHKVCMSDVKYTKRP